MEKLEEIEMENEESKSKAWGGLIVAIPVSVALSWAAIAGTYKQKIETIEHTNARQEIVIDANEIKIARLETKISSFESTLVKRQDRMEGKIDYIIERLPKQ